MSQIAIVDLFLLFHFIGVIEDVSYSAVSVICDVLARDHAHS